MPNGDVMRAGTGKEKPWPASDIEERRGRCVCLALECERRAALAFCSAARFRAAARFRSAAALAIRDAIRFSTDARSLINCEYRALSWATSSAAAFSADLRWLSSWLTVPSSAAARDSRFFLILRLAAASRRA